jgi:putative endonuclease
MWSVYVLRSSKDGKRYVGISNDVQKRIAEHNSGQTRSTKGRRPFELIYREDFKIRTEAREREVYFKTAAGRRFLAKIQKTENDADVSK